MILVFLLVCLVGFTKGGSTWNCTTTATKEIGKTGSGIVWWQGNCTGVTPYASVGPIKVNTLRASFSNPKLIVTTLHANTSRGVETLPKMMRQDARLLAGVNGGYFFRIDVGDFFDDVCFGKTKQEAAKPVDKKYPNYGIGDGLIMKDGNLIASNCNTSYGYNRPTTLILDGMNSSILIQSGGAPAPAGVKNALAAGPNLVSWSTNGSFVNVPQDDENVNKFEHAANTAVGLVGAPGNVQEIVMTTFDGADNCLFDPTCGINSYSLAYFMKDYMNTFQAMNMDQGGSTTMSVLGQGNQDNIVSCSSVPNCQGGGRLLYSGLFVGLEN